MMEKEKKKTQVMNGLLSRNYKSKMKLIWKTKMDLNMVLHESNLMFLLN